MGGITSWAHRAALSKREMSEDKQRFTKALDAEDALGAVVQELGHLADHIHLRKRVWVPGEGRKREIDVIAVCQCLYVVEVKNWSGKVWRNEQKRWFQLPPRQNARALEFNDVLGEVEYKAKALVALLHRSGVDVPPGSVRAVVVFSSDNVKLDPVTIGKDPSVFTKHQFKEIVEQRSVMHDTLSTYVPMLFAGKNEITPPLRAKINAVLGGVRTWDVVRLHNGERYTGDLKWLRLNEFKDWKHANDKDQHLNVMRKDLKSVDLRWSSASWWGMFAAAWQGAAGVVYVTLQDYVPLTRTKPFLAAARQRGEKVTAVPDVRDFQRLKAAGTLDPMHVPPPTIAVPLTTRSSKSHIVDVNHISFHPAGQVAPLVLALSEIATIELSGDGE